MRRALVVLVLLVPLVGSASSAHAGRGKSRTVAVALGGIGTAVSSGLILTSALVSTVSGDVVNKPLFTIGFASSIVTPSLGQFYAGEYLTIGMGVRAASAALAGLAVLGLSETHRCNQDQECTNLTQAGVVVVGMAAIGYVGGAAYDLGATMDAVDKHNRSIGIFVGMARPVDPRAAQAPLFGLQGRW